MEFLRGFDVNDNGKIILKHTVSMLKSLGFHTLAEGVETEEQYHFLRGLGCELVQGYFIGRPMPLDQGCELMNSDGRGFEDGNERHFYNNLGRIDILKQNPLKNLHNDNADALPLAIGIVKDGYWTFAYANKAYLDTISSNNNVTLQAAEEMINSGSFRWGEANMFWDLCDQSKRSGAPESIEFVDNGKIINMRVRHVSSDEVLHIDAYLVSVRVLTHYLNESYEEKINSVSKYMLTFYECVDLFGINTPYFENIYLYNSKVHINELNLDSRSVIELIATEKVHDDDRQAFRQFMDLDTIEERISQSRNGIIEGFFNIKDIYDKYELKVVTLRIIQINNNRAILSCVVPVSKFITNKLRNNESLTRNLSVDDNTVDDLTAYNILNLLPVGIFWKDQRRRFIGANKMFLDYYNLSSINAILGKTDEDMGWHIDPEPFKKDELKIINEGHIINNVEGECIVQGQVRKILATKRPFIVDGRIVGLVGYFKDVTEDVQKSGEMKKKASTDPLTGLFNRRGFDEILPKYIEQFEKEHVDFAVLIMDVDRFKQVNDMYGHNFGDAVLKTVSEKLKRIAGESSVVARIGGDEFILLHQLKNVSEINSIIQEIDINISRIESIENEKFKPSLSKGFALYSEHLDIKRTIDAADKNMYSEKKHHGKSSDKPIDRF
jgi:diguanylate cyclase (GGDEF)-like protein